ncbi:ABC transporter substrate-binding protein, partial [Kineococcus glutinatus]|uniref:ABC transporter substrate-binding protein n=1 Tax=Kineococcus glutinatus TaxID=1070872 RepID=UPI0031EE32A4
PELLAAAVLGLGSCGGASASSSATPADAAPTEGAVEGATRTVDTAFGPVEIPADPQRVVALEGGVGPLLDAGITPVGTADGDQDYVFLPEEYEQVKDLPIVLGPDGLLLEEIAELEPDLLIGFVRGGKEEELSAEKQAEFEKLSAIAPTVLVRATGSATVKDSALQMSEALGDGEEAQAEKQRYLDRAAQIKTEYADVLSTNVIAAVDSSPEEAYVYSPISWMGGILTDIGATLPAVAATETEENAAFLSFEQLGRLDEATIVLHEQNADGTPGPGAADLAAQPTYAQLTAVREGRDYGVTQFFADRYKTALVVLDQLEAVLAEQR